MWSNWTNEAYLTCIVKEFSQLASVTTVSKTYSEKITKNQANKTKESRGSSKQVHEWSEKVIESSEKVEEWTTR